MESVMRRFKRTTVIMLWFFAITIATWCYFIYLRQWIPGHEYYRVLALTAYTATFICVISGLIAKIIGKRIAEERDNWDDIVNELSSENMSTQERIFLITYIIFGFSLAVVGPPYLIALGGPQLGF